MRIVIALGGNALLPRGSGMDAATQQAQLATVAPGIGALALVPVFWIALHGSRRQLLVIIVGVCVFFLAPALQTGELDQPISIWRVAIVLTS